MAVKSNLKRVKIVLGGVKDFLRDVDSLEERKATEAVALAKRNVEEMDAVDTGRLQMKVGKDKRGRTTVFHSQAIDPDDGEDYAPEVHFGLASRGRNSVPRPYLQNAFDWFKSQMYKGIIELFNKNVRK